MDQISFDFGAPGEEVSIAATRIERHKPSIGAKSVELSDRRSTTRCDCKTLVVRKGSVSSLPKDVPQPQVIDAYVPPSGIFELDTGSPDASVESGAASPGAPCDLIAGRPTEAGCSAPQPSVASPLPPGESSGSLIGASGLARRALISDPVARPVTLADCFDFVGSRSEVPKAFRDLLPAARRIIARDTGHDLGDLSAAPESLRPLLAETHLRRRKLPRSRWNGFTVLRSVLVLAGWCAPEAALRQKLPCQWEDLLAAANAQGKRRALATFFRHSYRSGRRLDGIDSAALADFGDFLTCSTLDPDPRETVMLARSAWTFMRANHAGWPSQELSAPPRRTVVKVERDETKREPLIGPSGLAGRSLIIDDAARPKTLGGCFDFVMEHAEVPAHFRQEVPAIRQRIEQLTRRNANDTPSDPVALRPVLAGIHLKKYSTSQKRWTEFAVLQSVLILTGWVSLEARLRYKLPRAWETLLVAAEKYGRRRGLASFFRHCHRLDLSVSAMNADALIAYVDWLARSTLDPDPWRTALLVQQAWVIMRKWHPSWPAQDVCLPPRRTSVFAIRSDLRNEPLVNSVFMANRALISNEADRPPSLGACLDFVANHPDVPPRFKREARGARSTLSRVTGQDATNLPVDPPALRPILASVQPILFKLSNKRWLNVQAIVRSTLILCGWISAATRKRHVLPEPWAALVSMARLRQLDRALTPFFRFCHRLGLTPDTVTSETLRDYADWLLTSTLKSKAWQAAHWVQSAWRRMQGHESAWPVAQICLPSRRVAKRRTDFIAEFYADVDSYLKSLTKHHLRDPTYRRPVSPATLKTIRASILRAATYLANTGTPVADIVGIATLVEPAAFETILIAALDEAGGRWNVLARHIANNLFLAAKRWVKLPETVIKDLKEQVSCVQVGRSERRRRGLVAQFATLEDRDDLFQLPWRAFEQADLMLKQAERVSGPREPAAKLHEIALALALLLTLPMRIRNLVALDIDRNLQRDKKANLTRIFVDAYEVKNAKAIEIHLSDPLVARIERHFMIFRPILLRALTSTALFVGRGGGQITTQSLGKRLRRLVERQLGARFTAHLARHLTAEYLLEKDINNLPVAQNLLGHTTPHTTAAIYGGQRTSAAQRVYAGLLEQDRMAIAAKENQPKKGPTSKGRNP